MAISKANVSLKLSGDIKKNQELGRFEFGPTNVALTGITCSENSDVYAYATNNTWGSEPTFYDFIDGKPAYYLDGLRNFAYVMVDNESGLPYQTHSASVLKMGKGIMQPKSTSLFIYAAKDNPQKPREKATGTGFLRIYKDINKETYGISYRTDLDIEAAQPICTIENTILEIPLHRIATSSFPDIGYSNESGKGTGNLMLSCTGELSSSIKITINNSASLNGQQSIIVPDHEGQTGNSSGVGFVLSSPLSNNKPFIHNTFVSLGKLKIGMNQVPIDAKYYRYSKNIKPGKAAATVSFVIRFD
ncbi:hypothetical protein MASR2M36_07990 [Providencia sp.]